MTEPEWRSALGGACLCSHDALHPSTEGCRSMETHFCRNLLAGGDWTSQPYGLEKKKKPSRKNIEANFSFHLPFSPGKPGRLPAVFHE